MIRGQISQVFIFIMALLIIGVIVIVFTKSLGGILGDKCTADVVKFNGRIIEAIALNNDYGTVHNEKITVPCDFHTLCLVDATSIGDDLIGEFPGEFIIKNSVSDGVKENVFLITGEDIAVPSGYVSQLQLDDKTTALCIPSNGGKFDLLTRGQGRMTLVSADGS